MAVIFVLYPPLTHKTNVLLSSYPCVDRPNRCYSERRLNQDDSEKVILLELQVLFRGIKLLSDSHLSFHIRYRCCCRWELNQDDLEEVIAVEWLSLENVLIAGYPKKYPATSMSEEPVGTEVPLGTCGYV